MRILMVNKYAHVTGGADSHCLALAAALRERGHVVAFLSTADTENVLLPGAFIPMRVSHTVRDDLSAHERLDVAKRAVWNADAAAAMHGLVQRFQPDVVHAHKLFPQLSIAPLVVASNAGLPIVQTLHDYEFLSASAIDHRGGAIDRVESRISYRLLNTVTFPIRRWPYARRVTNWVAGSRFVADRYACRGIRPTVLPFFVDSTIGRPAPLVDRNGAAFVGRLQVEKGVHDVISVARMLPALPVTIAGDGPLADAVRRCAEHLPNLTFLGKVGHRRIPELLGRSRIALMPSRWQEPAGVAALEAMAVGTPVLAYANGGLGEYVRDAGGGCLITGNADALANACWRLHEDEQTWTELSERGVAAVAAKHSRKRYLPSIERIYASPVPRVG